MTSASGAAYDAPSIDTYTMEDVAALEQRPDLVHALNNQVGQLRLRYCPWYPHLKQEWFLLQDALEAFYGGAAGPGKSVGLLMAALQYVDVPGYNALILREELLQFHKPKALIPLSKEWLGPTDASWNGTLRQWTFPSGATLSFGYLRTVEDLKQYMGPAYAFLGWDELTAFTEALYRPMFRLLRDAPPLPEGGTVPLRNRSASNPGGIGHSWVKSRFVTAASREPGAVFVPATIHDNPHMDYDEYLVSLAHLSPVDRERLIKGDWDVMEEGGVFSREAFDIIDINRAPAPVNTVRYWDLAATAPHPSNTDPDFTCGVLLDLDARGRFTVRDIVLGKWGEADVEDQVRQTAYEDGADVAVYIEQDPGAAGKIVLGHYKRTVLQGYACHAGLTRGLNKESRAKPWSAAVANGLVDVVRGMNIGEYLDQHAIFPNAGAHDDCVDASSGAHYALTRAPVGHGSSSSPHRHRLPGVGAPR